jgi:hypothetical protein
MIWGRLKGQPLRLSSGELLGLPKALLPTT